MGTEIHIPRVEQHETLRINKQIAIVGASGRVGSRLQTNLCKDYQITLIRHESELPEHKKNVREYSGLDITYSASTETAIHNLRLNGIRLIVNSAGLTTVDQSESERTIGYGPMYKANVNGAKNLAIACRNEGLTLLHLSTEYIFNGRKPVGQKYTEDDEPDTGSLSAPTWYGLTKAAGEIAVLQEHPEGSLIVRLSQVQSPAGGLFLATLKQLAKGEKFTRANNQMVSPITDITASLALDKIITAQRIGQNKHNIYHVSATDAMTSYEVSLMLSEAYGLGDKAKELIIPTPIEEIVASGEQKVVRPKNSILSVARFEHHFAGQTLRTVEEEVHLFHRLYPNLA